MQGNTNWQKIYLPERLRRELARIAQFPVTVVEAPSGFGKTTAVREYLKEAAAGGARQHWYTCLGESPSAAWTGICGLLSNVDGELANSLQKPGFPLPESLVHIQARLQNIRCAEETFLVVDNCHLIQSGILKELISVFSMHASPKLHMVFIAQHLGMHACGACQGSGIHTIGSSAFFFDRESTAILFRLEGIRLSDEELNSVCASTEGWIAAIRLQISHYRQTGSLEHTADIDKLVETAIWNRLTEKQRECLLTLSVLGSFSARQAAVLLGEETLPDCVRDLLDRSEFIRYFPRERVYVMHGILRNYLQNRFHQFQPRAFQLRVLRAAGQCCAAESDFLSAARYFFQVRDFDAILSLPWTLRDLTVRREGAVALLADIVGACPDEILCRYPFALLAFACLMRLEGEHDHAGRLCRLAELCIKSNPAGLSAGELRRLKGEHLLLEALHAYNDLKRVREGQAAAYELLQGPSRFGLNAVPVTLGAASVLSMFWREPGRMEETLRELKSALPCHLKLTHQQGAGADSAYQAEMMLLRGDDVQAEILCHKALYQARSRQEICICLCAEQILARIAILRGDAEGFELALQNIKGYAGENAGPHVSRMVDICLAILGAALGAMDMVPKWLLDFESIGKAVYAGAVPYVSALHAHLLASGRRHAELLALADHTIQSAKEMHYVLPQLYCHILKAQAYYATGQKQQALSCIAEAFALAQPDRVYLPFAQFAHLGDILSKSHAERRRKPAAAMAQQTVESSAFSQTLLKAFPDKKADINAILALYHRYQRGRKGILHALGQEKSALTPREREVALLAKARLSHKEIAEQLCISTATVRTILYNAYGKLGVHSKAELSRIDF